jgi:hypothetical protein
MNSYPEHASDELEALIRAAGNYVRPSDDLRPLVLEEARLARSERRAQDRIWQFVLAVMFVAIALSSWRGYSPSGLDAASALESAAPASAASSSPPHDNPTWHAVDSFSALRRRQASLLQLAM